jgi:glycosyltransferase involved in cell wall biosynthesis
MVAATVLLPTHDHGETLRCSIPTALRQTVEDIELFIIGDGVPDVTREIARDFAARDRRVRFFDFPKGPGRGERYRHEVLQQAAGEIVCYLFDDDLWLSDHVAVVREALRHADFVFTLSVQVTSRGELLTMFADLQRPLHRSLFTNPRSTTVSVPTCAAHTMALYRRLPYGWRAAPPGLASDKYMWAQCLTDPATVARGIPTPTAVIFPDPQRRGWATDRRLDELREWSGRLEDEAWRSRFVRDVAAARRRPDAILRLYSWMIPILSTSPARSLLRLARR